jgi:hypothetical protein
MYGMLLVLPHFLGKCFGPRVQESYFLNAP